MPGPNYAGDAAGWTNSSGATGAPNPGSSDYASYSLTGPSFESSALELTNFGFSGVASVDTIQVTVHKASSGGTVKDLTVSLMISGSPTGDDKADTSTAWIDIGTGWDNTTYSVDDWGVSWTPANVEDVSFGLYFRAKGTLGTETALVDAVTVIITEAAPVDPVTGALLPPPQHFMVRRRGQPDLYWVENRLAVPPAEPTEASPDIATPKRFPPRAPLVAYDISLQAGAELPLPAVDEPAARPEFPEQARASRRAPADQYRFENRLSLPMDVPIRPDMPEQVYRPRRAVQAAYEFSNRVVQPDDPVMPPARFDVPRSARRAAASAYFVSSSVPPESAPVQSQFVGIDSPDVMRRANPLAYQINVPLPPEEPLIPGQPAISLPQRIAPRARPVAYEFTNLLSVPEIMPTGQVLLPDRAPRPRRAASQAYAFPVNTVPEFPPPVVLGPDVVRRPRRASETAYWVAVQFTPDDLPLDADGGPQPYRTNAADEADERVASFE